MTRREWYIAKEQLGWDFACFEEYILNKRRELLKRLKELTEKEPKD
jgi:hypothetical protein